LLDINEDLEKENQCNISGAGEIGANWIDWDEVIRKEGEYNKSKWCDIQSEMLPVGCVNAAFN